jgi:hypothetical protein
VNANALPRPPETAMTAASTARIVGVLIRAQMVGGALVNLVLAAPLFGPLGFRLLPGADEISSLVICRSRNDL